MKAIGTGLSRKDWQTIAGLLVIYSVIYLPIGLGSGFLKVAIRADALLGVLVGAFISPAFSEELVFRVLPIPHKTEHCAIAVRCLSMFLSWIAFIVYHPLNPFGEAFFGDWVFLIGAGLLGAACTIAYVQSGSFWAPVLIHWLAVSVWLLVFGGLERFQ